MKCRKTLWIFIFCITYLSVFSQINDRQFYELTIEVLDHEFDYPISFVEVYSSGDRILGMTDSLGIVKIDVEEDIDTLKFVRLGYIPRSLDIGSFFPKGKTIYLKAVENKTVVVSGRRKKVSESGSIKNEIIYLDGPEISTMQSTADALNPGSEIYIQKSQFGGGSPIIRGMEANRILLVLDGVRLNHPLYRSGHLQNAITVDPLSLGQIEITYGPGSLIYGSDALGGVIHFRTRMPNLIGDEKKKVKFNWSGISTFSSANRGISTHLAQKTSMQKIALYTGIRYNRTSDLRSGANRPLKYPDLGKCQYYADRINGRDTVLKNPNVNIQKKSNHSQFDVHQKIKWKIKDSLTFISNFQYSTSGNVPRYDQLTDTLDKADELNYASWYYGPQNRLLASIELISKKPTVISDQIQLQASYQNMDEDRFSRRFNSVDEVGHASNIQVFSVTVESDKRLGNHKLIYGIGGDLNLVEAHSFSKNINSGIVDHYILSRLPEGPMTTWNAGAYLQYLYSDATNNMNYNIGVRYSQAGVEAIFEPSNVIDWHSEFGGRIVSNSNSLTYGGSWKWQLNHRINIGFEASSGFRQPNLDDLVKVRAKAGSVTIPNSKLGPESIYTFAGNATIRLNSYLEGGVNGYISYLKDAIVQSKSALPDGDTLLLVDGKMRRVISNQNIESARITGCSFWGKLKWKGWTVKTSLSYQKGRIIREEVRPFDHISPLFGSASTGYQDKRWGCEISMEFNGPKLLKDYGSGSSENLEYATPEGSLAWFVWNGRIWINVHMVRIILSVHNISDVHYRPYSSGISSAGRDVVIAVQKLF